MQSELDDLSIGSGFVSSSAGTAIRAPDCCSACLILARLELRNLLLGRVNHFVVVLSVFKKQFCVIILHHICIAMCPITEGSSNKKAMHEPEG